MLGWVCVTNVYIFFSLEKQFGTITSFEQKESEVLVQYGQRFEAERAMTAGPNYPKGTLQLAWISETTTEES